jgi:hypothetical protein
VNFNLKIAILRSSIGLRGLPRPHPADFPDAIEMYAKATKISELAKYPGWMTNLETKSAELIVSEQRKLLDAKRAQPASR